MRNEKSNEICRLTYLSILSNHIGNRFVFLNLLIIRANFHFVRMRKECQSEQGKCSNKHGGRRPFLSYIHAYLSLFLLLILSLHFSIEEKMEYTTQHIARLSLSFRFFCLHESKQN